MDSRPYFDETHGPAPKAVQWRRGERLPKSLFLDLQATSYESFDIGAGEFADWTFAAFRLSMTDVVSSFSRDVDIALDLWASSAPPTVFGAIERIAVRLAKSPGPWGASEVEACLNGVLRRNGVVDLSLTQGRFVLLDSQGLAEGVAEASRTASEQGRDETGERIERALAQLALAPDDSAAAKDAIEDAHHAAEMAARHAFGDKARLKQIAASDGFRQRLPAPLSDVVSKLSGYCSEVARHRHDGQAVSFESARFVVHVCASLVALFMSGAALPAFGNDA